jgi:hypothetical protein
MMRLLVSSVAAIVITASLSTSAWSQTSAEDALRNKLIHELVQDNKVTERHDIKQDDRLDSLEQKMDAYRQFMQNYQLLKGPNGQDAIVDIIALSQRFGSEALAIIRNKVQANVPETEQRAEFARIVLMLSCIVTRIDGIDKRLDTNDCRDCELAQRVARMEDEVHNLESRHDPAGPTPQTTPNDDPYRVTPITQKGFWAGSVFISERREEFCPWAKLVKIDANYSYDNVHYRGDMYLTCKGRYVLLRHPLVSPERSLISTDRITPIRIPR